MIFGKFLKLFLVGNLSNPAFPILFSTFKMSFCEYPVSKPAAVNMRISKVVPALPVPQIMTFGSIIVSPTEVFFYC